MKWNVIREKWKDEMEQKKKNTEGGQALHRPGGYCDPHYEPLRAHNDTKQNNTKTKNETNLKKSISD